MKDLFSLGLPEFSHVDFPCGCGRTHVLNADFHYGNYKALLADLVRSRALGGKIAVIAGNDMFLKYGRRAAEALEEAGCTPVNVILKNTFDKRLENAGGLFRLPEDVRLAVVTDNELFDAASYFAGIRGIPLALVPASTNVQGGAGDTVTVNVRGYEETFFTGAERIFLIDEALFRKCEPLAAADTFAEIISKTVAMIDYRVRGAMRGEWQCRESYNLAREVVSDTFRILNYSESGIPLRLLENQLRMTIACSFTDGALFAGSGEEQMAKLLEYESGLPLAECRFFAALRLLELYRMYFAGELDGGLKLPDYSARAALMARITGQEEYLFLKSFSENRIPLGTVLQKKGEIAAKLSSELEGLCAIKEKIYNTYLALGGNPGLNEAFSDASVRGAAYSAPDFPDSFNTLTLMREEGILEYLK